MSFRVVGDPFESAVGRMELKIPAIKWFAGPLLYFVIFSFCSVRRVEQ